MTSFAAHWRTVEAVFEFAANAVVVEDVSDGAFFVGDEGEHVGVAPVGIAVAVVKLVGAHLGFLLDCSYEQFLNLPAAGY